MAQLDSLKQTGSVEEYYNRFVDLSHNILLYNPAYDHVFFVNRFLTGLRDDIRSATLLHRPRDVETASALALLQEAELENVKKKFNSKYESGSSSKLILKSGYSSDKSKLKVDNTGVEEPKHKEKLESVRAYRRENFVSNVVRSGVVNTSVLSRCRCI